MLAAPIKERRDDIPGWHHQSLASELLSHLICFSCSPLNLCLVRNGEICCVIRFKENLNQVFMLTHYRGVTGVLVIESLSHGAELTVHSPSAIAVIMGSSS